MCGEIKPGIGGIAEPITQRTEPRDMGCKTQTVVSSCRSQPGVLRFGAKPKDISCRNKPGVMSYRTKPWAIRVQTKPGVISCRTKP